MNQLTTTAQDTRTKLELAKAFAEATIVPDHFKKNVGNCYIAINIADRYKMDAWSVMQELYIIQNKPFMSGKLSIAILNNSLADPLRPEYSGEGDTRAIKLTGRPEGEPQPLSVTLNVKDAKTTNEQWKKNPDQMLMYAASRMWGRRYVPDILLGIQFDDEAEEINANTNTPSPKPKTEFYVAPPKEQQKHELIDEETGEVLDAIALPKSPNESWYDWCARFVAVLRELPDIQTIDMWLAANSETLKACHAEAAKTHGNFLNAVKTAKANLLESETAQ
jgi:hypothetical protein